MNPLLFLLIGLVAGWLAGRIMRGHGFGALGNIAAGGMAGAVLGGLLFGALGLEPEARVIGQLVSATVGAVLLLVGIDRLWHRRES